MSESKTVIYSPDSGMAGGNGMMAMLAPLLQQRGIDPNLLVALNGKNGNQQSGRSYSSYSVCICFIGKE